MVILGEFSSDLYRALVCDMIIRKCIFRIYHFSGLFLLTPLTLNYIKSVWATLQNTLLLEKCKFNIFGRSHTIVLLVYDMIMFEAAKHDFIIVLMNALHQNLRVILRYKISVFSGPQNCLSCFADNISNFVSVWHKIIFMLVWLRYAILMLYKGHH